MFADHTGHVRKIDTFAFAEEGFDTLQHSDTRSIQDFIRESNFIEKEYDYDAFVDACAAWDYLSEKQITPESILATHKILLGHLNERIAGKWRKVAVSVGGRHCPAPGKNDMATAVERLCNNPPTNEVEIRKWHVDFEKIHPFEDGNGRTGRLIMNVQRIRRYLPVITIYEADRHAYYEWFAR